MLTKPMRVWSDLRCDANWSESFQLHDTEPMLLCYCDHLHDYGDCWRCCHHDARQMRRWPMHADPG